RFAGCAFPRADPEGPRVCFNGGRGAPGSANPWRGRRDARGNRRPGDDAGRGPAGPWPPCATRLGRHRLARTAATARDRPRTGERASDPDQAESVAAALTHVFAGERKLLVLDGYADVEEPVVDALAGFLRGSRGRGKLLVLAQESTPAYCRFYSRSDVDAGLVAERHLRGLDLEGCRAMLGHPTIDPEALRRVYLLTNGCPLYLP